MPSHSIVVFNVCSVKGSWCEAFAVKRSSSKMAFMKDSLGEKGLGPVSPPNIFLTVYLSLPALPYFVSAFSLFSTYCRHM